MADSEGMVRVWTGLNPLQTQYMEEVLKEHGIEYMEQRETAFGAVTGVQDASLWVRRRDEKQAGKLLEEAEEAMSEALEAEAGEEEQGEEIV